MESIRLFGFCESMKWSHLPWPGALYDQHPGLLEQWRYIFTMRAEHEREDDEKRKREQNNTMSRDRGAIKSPSRSR